MRAESGEFGAGYDLMSKPSNLYMKKPRMRTNEEVRIRRTEFKNGPKREKRITEVISEISESCSVRTSRLKASSSTTRLSAEEVKTRKVKSSLRQKAWTADESKNNVVRSKCLDVA